jgi:ABC-type branched-subunit amino acid transport system substrate-binding protein
MEHEVVSRAFRRRSAVALAALVHVAACAPEPSQDPDAVKVGLLLPFTGACAATSHNFELAVLFARDQINARGGVEGRHVEIVSADTHSDSARARQSVSELFSAGVRVVIGPESADIAADIKQMLDDRDIVFVSPLVGAADDQAVSCTTPWFRLAPSSRALGEALAKQARTDLITNAALFYTDGAYDVALAAAFRDRFVSLGGTITVEDPLPSGAESYATHIAMDDLSKTDAIVLSTSPRDAALLVNELRFVNQRRDHWYLSPLLKTDLLLENVAPGALDGATGVTPKILPDNTAEFSTEFARHWSGEQPLDGAYFYYDAMALTAFGLERAALAGSQPDSVAAAAALRAGIVASSGSSGEAGGWNGIGTSLHRLHDGVNMYYSGLTGPILLQKDCGDRRTGESTIWQVEGGRIQN